MKKEIPITPDTQKYVKFYFQDGFIKTDTNLSQIEILGVIERIKHANLCQVRIHAEEQMKKQEEGWVDNFKATWKPINKSWKKLNDNIQFKKYNLSFSAEPKKKKVVKKKAVKKPNRKQTKAN